MHRALGRLDGAGKFRNHAVPGTAEDPAAVVPDQAVNHFPALLKHLQCFLFVRGHHLAETDYVGGEDGAQFSFGVHELDPERRFMILLSEIATAIPNKPIAVKDK